MQQDLEERMKRIEDYVEICNLQGRYNHYMLCNRGDKILELFAKDDPDLTIEVADSGEYKGFEGVIRVFSLIKSKYDFSGALPLHMLMTPIVEVSKDGKTARGMWHSFGCNTFFDEEGQLRAMWQAGKYDLEFVKVDGKWKYRKFRWYVIFRTPYEKGWVEKPIVEGLSEEGGPEIGPLYAPFDPKKRNDFLPLPPE